MAFSSDIPIIVAGAVGLIALIVLVLRLRRIQAALLKSRRELARLKLTLELSEGVGRFGSWHVDTAAETVKWSDYIFDMHARPHSKGEPTLDEAIAYYHPDDIAIVQNAVARALSEGEDFEYRARIITERGNELPVMARGTCQFDQNGNIVGVFGCFVDLSQQTNR